MRLLLFADLHLDTPFRWAPPAVAQARRRALRETLTRIVRLAEVERVDAICCAGDLYEHERFTPDTTAFLRDTFASTELPVHLAPGNHDWYGPASAYARAGWSPNVHVFTDDRLTPVELADGLTLWGAAHRAPADTDGFLDGFRVDRGGVHLALIHGSERSGLRWQDTGKVPHAPFAEEQVPESGLAHALCGHFHAPRDGQWHTYPGNPDPLTFGESGERGAVVVDVADDGSVRRTRHRVAVSEVHDVEVDLTGVRHESAARDRVARRLAPLTGTVRLALTGEVGSEVVIDPAALADVAPHLDAVVPRPGVLAVPYDLDRLAAEQTVRGQFVRDVRTDEVLDDDTRRRVLLTGLRALDGRADALEVR